MSAIGPCNIRIAVAIKAINDHLQTNSSDPLGLRPFVEDTSPQVDHIIPLQSDPVCGLHCWANLQLMSRADNRRKSNTYQQDW